MSARTVKAEPSSLFGLPRCPKCNNDMAPVFWFPVKLSNVPECIINQITAWKCVNCGYRADA